ncbi:MAG: hypothetical protein C5B57_12340 [Blastocatellia bacterium]|nr:MAG: hypothetical protein C5B57_12340 [Blastocatellia bacterium]
MKRFIGPATLLAVMMSSAAVLSAQSRATTSDLSGVVYDESHAVFPGATITITNVETSQSRTTTSDALGRFVIPALPPGTYRVTAEGAGFASQSQDVTLELGAQVALDFTLKLAGVAEQVTVAAASPVIARHETAIANVISQRQINALPINGRDFMSFSVISPGVTRDNTPQQGASATSGLTFAGQRARSNNITVDGVDNNDLTVGSVRAVFSQEAVREFQVVTNSYSAEFGKASGGVVNIVTKSGTNQPSGNAFIFFRDSALNAKEYFERFTPAGNPIDRDKAPYRHKQFGGTFGGPIRKNRTFFFGSFERLDVQANNFVNIDDTTPLTLFGQPIGTVADVLRRSGFPVETGNVPYAVRSDQVLIKVDHQVATNQLGLRYNYADTLNENIEPWGGLVAKSRGAALDSTDHMFAASYNAVGSPHFVNELRFQFAERDQTVNSLDPNCGGPCTEETQGGPTLEILGVASVGRQRFTPQPRLNDRVQVLDTVTRLAGNHQLKAGFDFNYVNHRTSALPLHFGGRYLFQPLPAIPGVLPAPINGIQALSLGLPAAYIQGYGTASKPYGYSDLSVFTQDDWRLSENLSARLGIRYQKQFWPDAPYTTPGVPFGYSFPTDNNNVAPRLGISWNPRGDARTSVHAAYGMYYDNLITAAAGVAYIVNGAADGVQTLVARFPATISAWNAPGHKLPVAAAGAFPSLVIAIDPGLETPYAHHVSAGVDRELAGALRLAVNYVHVRGFHQLGTIDYNPVLPALGAGRRPLDVDGRAGTSASVLQYTSFGDTWYDGLVVSAAQRYANRYQYQVSYTLSKAEDNSTDFQTAFLPENNGRGRNPADVRGLPIGFDAASERGASLQDQRHRLVLSGLYEAPHAISFSTILTVASGRPYNILAGADLNGDGDGGTIPGPDRARAVLSDPSTSIPRDSGRLPAQASLDLRVTKQLGLGGRRTIDAIFEVFNVFNKANMTDINNIFGVGAYPTNPLPTFGQFQQAAPPRQVQLAVKMNF